MATPVGNQVPPRGRCALRPASGAAAARAALVLGALIAPVDVAALLVLHVDPHVVQELLRRPGLPGPVPFELREDDLDVFRLQRLAGGLLVPDHVLDALDGDGLELGVEPGPRAAEHAARVLPEFR